MTFRMFVKSQVERLSQFAGFSTLAEPGRIEIIDFVARSSGDRLDKRDDKIATEWLRTAPGQRVKALVEECLTYPDLDDPGPAVRRTWQRLNPVVTGPIAEPGCVYCGGSGWEEFEVTLREGVFAGEKRNKSKRCRCGGMPPKRHF